MSSKKILLIDNYDSFTYNLYQLISSLNANVDVFRNDSITLSELKKKPFSHVVISPGPKGPQDSAVSLEAIDYFKDKLPILGVCLGMQAIGYIFGSKIVRHTPVHGKKDVIRHKNIGIHYNIPSPFKAARYNSLAVRDIDQNFLETTAENKDNEIMGLRHRQYHCLEGVQYHPESFMSQYGETLIENFLVMKYD